MYQTDRPFIERWRTAMRYLEEDLGSGYQKVWLELQAMARYGLAGPEFGVDQVVSLVMTFNQGIILERHSGIFQGHRELLAAIDAWLASREEGDR